MEFIVNSASMPISFNFIKSWKISVKGGVVTLDKSSKSYSNSYSLPATLNLNFTYPTLSNFEDLINFLQSTIKSSDNYAIGFSTMHVYALQSSLSIVLICHIAVSNNTLSCDKRPLSSTAKWVKYEFDILMWERSEVFCAEKVVKENLSRSVYIRLKVVVIFLEYINWL